MLQVLEDCSVVCCGVLQVVCNIEDIRKYYFIPKGSFLTKYFF